MNDPDNEFLITHDDPYDYYMMSEVSTSHQCPCNWCYFNIHSVIKDSGNNKGIPKSPPINNEENKKIFISFSKRWLTVIRWYQSMNDECARITNELKIFREFISSKSAVTLCFMFACQCFLLKSIYEYYLLNHVQLCMVFYTFHYTFTKVRLMGIFFGGSNPLFLGKIIVSFHVYE